MKIDYNQNKRVKINKPGHWNGMIGTIKNIKIEIDMGASGVWSFDQSEVELVGDADKIVKAEPIISIQSIENDEVIQAVEPQKRSYNKKQKSTEKPKEKRKYTRKIK